MAGESTVKEFEKGANSAKMETDLTDGIPETPAVGDKTKGTGTSMLSKDGAVGSMFNADGALGGTAQKIGGPLDKNGFIGKNFTADGKIGGMVQENLANKK